MLILFLKGILIGFLLALPVGPTMILCIRYALSFGALMGLATGAGASFADALYGVLAGYGIYVIETFMDKYHIAFHLVGSMALIVLGCKTMCDHAKIQTSTLKQKPKLWRIFLTTFALTGSSPLTFIGVSALCAALGISEDRVNLLSPWILALGIFIGACLWWQVLSSFFSFLKHKISLKATSYIGRISGSLLVIMGLCVLLYTLKPLA